MISRQTIEQIQARIDVIDVVGNFVKLKKRGTNYIGLCPFHNEKTPSFTVSPSKEIYKCFGCGKSGNAITFLMEHEKYNYVETLRWLAQRYNVEIEETEVSAEVRAQQQVSESLFILNEFAQKYFSEALFETEEGRIHALDYLKERGFREDIIQKFQLGYNPSARDAFSREALSKQYSEDLLIKSGLAVQRDGGVADNYRGRIIFPVHNQSGKVLGFGARIIQNNARAPKYINTPENELYVKSKILYGSYFARQAIDRENECLLVEGYTDVISLHQAGIENVVASGGTALTPDQLRLVRKYTGNLTILYDGDQAGIKAALRGMDLALEEGLNVKLALIPDGDDPDSYVNKVGAIGFREFIEREKKDFILFQLEVGLAEAKGDATQKTRLVHQMAETLSRMNRPGDFIRRQDYIRKIAEMLKIEEEGLTQLVNLQVRQQIARTTSPGKKETQNWDTAQQPEALPEEEVASPLFQQHEKQERAFVRALIEFGLQPWDEQQTVADYLFLEIAENELEEMMDSDVLKQIVTLYKQWYQAGEQPSSRSFLYYEDPKISQQVIALMEEPAEVSPNWNRHHEGKIITREERYRQEVASTLLYLKLRKVKRLLEENQKDVETTTDSEQLKYLLDTHLKLKEVEMALTKSVGTVILK